MTKKLEQYNIFTYIAWSTIILFALFVYIIIHILQPTITKLDTQTAVLHRDVNSDVNSDVMHTQLNNITAAH